MKREKANNGVSARHGNRSALAPTGTGLALKGMKGMKVSISKQKTILSRTSNSLSCGADQG